MDFSKQEPRANKLRRRMGSFVNRNALEVESDSSEFTGASTADNRDSETGFGLEVPSSSSSHQLRSFREGMEKIDEHLNLFYEPEPATTANLDIYFLHGLDCELEAGNVDGADILKWRSTGQPEEVWPRKWLPEDFPQARIVSICYDWKITDTYRDLCLLAEKLFFEITSAREGSWYTPMIFVSHGFGGIVMREMCLFARMMEHRGGSNYSCQGFLEDIGGLFFYDSPHLSMEGIEAPVREAVSPLMRPSDETSERRRDEFLQMQSEYPWIIFGLAAFEEPSSTCSSRLRVPEASSVYGDRYRMVRADHSLICRPRNRHDKRYTHLEELIGKVLSQVKGKKPRRPGKKLNDYVYELYKPMEGPADMDILFFDGVNLMSNDSNDKQIPTWISREGRKAHVWPKTWLSQDFPRARILAISYDSHLITMAEQGKADLHNVAGALTTCLRLGREDELDPLILVGHSFGGVLIKQLCVHVHSQLQQGEGEQMKMKLRCFLRRIKPILFLGTPHHGMRLPGLQKAALGESNPLQKHVEVFNEDACRLHSPFDQLTRTYKWRIASVGELNETKWGASRCIMVPEASARYGEFIAVQVDHFALSKPREKDSPVYKLLTALIERASSRINEWLSLLYEPEPTNTANLNMFFIHGLDFEFPGLDVQDADILTWRSRRRKPEEVWPQKWLPKDFAKARVISLSYNCSTTRRNERERRNLHVIAESLLDQITRFQGERGYTPMILVGHGFGGLVMKYLCIYAQSKDCNIMYDRFLKSIRGLYFYDTPHLGMTGIESLVENEGELLGRMRYEDRESGRLHADFQHLHRKYRWIIFGLGAKHSSSWMRASFDWIFAVPEESSRYGEDYLTVFKDHFLTCRPRDRSDMTYVHLKELIERVLFQVEEENIRPGEKLNDYVYELYKPIDGPPEMDILFFQGLNFNSTASNDVHVSVWTSGKRGEAHLWPKTWLSQDFPDARILAISCDFHLITMAEQIRTDLHNVAKALLTCLRLDRDDELDPLILVGHSFGGVLIKQLCVHIDDQIEIGAQMKTKLRCFLKRIKSILFLATPHHGMTPPGLQEVGLGESNPLPKHVAVLNADAAGLHSRFDLLTSSYKWRIGSVGELNETQWGGSRCIMVPEASARYGEFISVPVDHFALSKPREKDSPVYKLLTTLIERVFIRLNDYVYELYKPNDGPAEMDVLFFHGLNLNSTIGGGIHLSTWISGEGREAHLWPKTWLSQDFPRARILAISCDSSLITVTEQGRKDLHNVAEALITCLRLDREDELDPLILVGHSVGGVLIKQLCVHVHVHDQPGEGAHMNTELRCFLRRIQAIFFLGTPHHGMTLPALQEARLGASSPLPKQVEVFNANAARLHSRFDQLARTYKWRIASVGELNETKMGASRCIMVPEASARYGEFISVPVDHFALSKPREKDSPVYKLLTTLIERAFSRINEWLSLLYEPEPANTADLDMLFFHGLDFEFENKNREAFVGDADFVTWRSTGEPDEFWPQKWLPKDLAKARVISLSYNCSMKRRNEREKRHLHVIAVSLLDQITRFQRERGYNPMILVGHGFGGIVMKYICRYAQSRDSNIMYDRFLKSIRGFYFYDTPHGGLVGIEVPVKNEGDLLGRMRRGDIESERLHDDFQHLHHKYRWIIYGLGGEYRAASMLTPFKYYFIPEGSSRYGEDFDIVPKDHVYTCRPRDRSDRTYVHLKELIERVLRQVEEENILRRGEQLNDYVYELYKPMDGPAEVDVLFFHGLNLNPTASNDIHVSTWTSGEGREAHLWPKTWLSQDFPRARILAISYDSHLITTAEQGRTDLHNAAESLMTCLLLEREASLLRPLVLVGHCFGGVLIKQLCVHAHDRQGEGAQMETELRCFLKKIKVILFLGTPHHGMTLPGLQEAARGESSPLVKDVEVFNAGAARLHERFDRLTREYKWRIAGVGELNETKWGESHCVMVPEASARYGEFTSVQADHISLSKPRGKHSHVYIRLTMLIEQPSSRHHTPGNNQTVPPIASELVAFEVVQAHRTLKSFTCLGFYGMGGVGKSTLARLVFNRLNQEFEYSCFISDVKLKTGISLEEVLANAMHHYGERMNYNEFTWGHLSGRRVLIVLDDVTKYEHLQILGNIASQVSSKEHRYIVTCRDVALLGTLRSILHPREVELYSVPLLGEASARKLLLSYGVPDPPAQEFVERVVTLCNGLPLSLEVIGKYLHENKGKEKIWEKSVDALHNCVNIHNFKERLWDILQFSYDHLADEAKEMFLDCASFFAGSSWRLHEAKVAWQSLFPNYADDFWESLVNMSLVYDVKDDDSIQMHEQMKDLGTKLAMFSGDGGKCSRTWNAKLLSKALGIASTEHWSGGRNPSSKRPSSGRPSRKQQISVSRRLPEGIKAVIALRLEEPMPITMEDISNMTGLRYLDSSKVLAPISGRRIPSGVVLLRWRGEFASIADVFDPEQMNELAVFHLEAPSLHKVPDSFGLLSELQILTFTGCKFSTLPQSFGELLGLQHLEFTNCTELCSLPESFGRLLDLEFFSFSVADVYGEKSSESGEQNFLPASFGDLKNLKNLILCGCRNLHSLPESFSKLKSLEELRIERCNNLLTLSQSFGELPELHTLDVCHCRNLRKVPASFGRLSKLRTVCISDCESFRAFPETLGDLVSLESLVISDCKRLHQLPGTLGQLSKLQKLEICGTEVDELPTTMSNLYNLQRLEIVKNEKLKSLPNFWDLSLQQHSGNKRSLLQLRHLLITECDQLDVLHTSLGHLPALRRLEISRCRRVPALPDSVEHLSQLEHLELIECEQICSLPDNFGNLTSLETLDISLCSISSLPDSFSNLRNLTKLSLLKCPLTDLPKEFGNLTRLILRDCNVSILPGSLSSLGNLKELEISNCPYLTNLPGSFGTITSLTKLTLSNCGVSILPDSFSKLVKLDELVILSCRLNGLPVDFQKLVALRLLTLIEVPWTSVPTCIKFLPSLHTLTVKLPDLTEECEWLGQGLSRVRSYNRFCKRNGGFCLMEEES